MVDEMAKLTMLMGLPCTGKTYFSHTLSGIKIELDVLRKGATGSAKLYGNFNELVHFLAQKSIQYYLSQDKQVVIDGLFLSAKTRKSYIDLAHKMKAEVDVYWFDLPIDLIKKRLIERNESSLEGDKVDVSQLNALCQAFDFPVKEEGFKNIYYLSKNE